MANMTLSIQIQNLQQLQQVNAVLQQMGVTINQVNVSATQHLTVMQQIARQYQIIIQSRVFFGVLAGMQSANDEAQKLARQITEIRTISQDLAISTRQWTQDIITLSNTLGSSATDVAAATYQTLSNNIAGARTNTLEFVKTAGQFAQVTQTTAKGGVDLLSSAINSYNLDASKATEVSAVLFNTIERGRIRSEAIQNIFGRVAVTANDVGVSLQELSAAMTVLSVKGLKETEVITQLNALFTAFLKPSAELTETYTKLGFASPILALQSQGLVNTLKQLKDITHGMASEAQKEFLNVRGLKAFIGLDPALVEKELAAISDPSKYTKAIDEVNKSMSNRLDRITQQFKNTFIDMGTTANNVIVTILGPLEKLEGGIKGVTTVMTALATGGSILLVIAQLERFGIVAAGAATALGAFLLTNPIFIAIAAGITTGIALQEEYNKRIEKTNQLLAKTSEAIKKNTEEAQREARPQQGSGDIRDRSGSATIRLLTEDAKKLQQSLADIKPAAQDAFNVLRANAQSGIDKVRDGVKDLNRDINDSFRNIANATKATGEFNAGIRKAVGEFQREFASPDQQQFLLRKQISDQEDLARKLAREAAVLPGAEGAAKFTEVRDALKEMVKLTTDLERLRVQAQGGGAVSTVRLESQLDDVRQLEARLTGVFVAGQRKGITDPVTGLQSQVTEREKIIRLMQVEKTEYDAILEKSEKQYVNLKRLDDLAKKLSIQQPEAERALLDTRNELFRANEKNNKEQKESLELSQNIKKADEEHTKLVTEISKASFIKDAKDSMAEAIKLAEQITVTSKGGVPKFTPSGIDPAPFKEITELLSSAKFNEALTKLKELPILPKTGLFTLGAKDFLEQYMKKLQEAADKAKEIEDMRQLAAGRLLEVAGDPGKAMTELKNTVIETNPVLEVTVGHAKDTAKNFNIAADAAARLKDEAGKVNAIPIRVPGSLTGNYAGGMASGMSGGGIGFGPDTFATHLAPGEVVLSARTVQLFGSQIASMAAAGRQSVSNTTNNLGAVNVYLQGTGYTEQDVRLIAGALERERRRGTL